jgi:hypothetical protein
MSSKNRVEGFNFQAWQQQQPRCDETAATVMATGDGNDSSGDSDESGSNSNHDATRV